MKLYATTTSERASKGQGGENIAIKLYDDRKVCFCSILVQKEKDLFYPTVRIYSNGKINDISGNEIEGFKIEKDIDTLCLCNTKGKKQKGENCIDCGGLVDNTKNCVSCRHKRCQTCCKNR